MKSLYLRYRPDDFSALVGQEQVAQPIQIALRSGRPHHAYLFSGPRGCGKTTSARILARCLNCAHGPTDTPCGECPSCIELSRDGGGSLDVVEIDAASHNGVDDARELRERAVFAPARDRYKIFILDEAHMVTQQGFNALLKIVEEPPEHVKFIFATTEPEKVLPTIRSRTHHYPFRLVPPGELLGYLERVAASEGVSADKGVLSLVVQAGGGSVRDSLSLLDQLIAGTEGTRVSLALAQALLGYTPQSVLNEALEALAHHDSRGLFRTINRAVESGNEPRRFVEDLLGHIRDVIVIQATGDNPGDLFPGVADDDLRTWSEQATWFDPQTLSDMADAIAHSLSEMSGVTAPKLQLELLAAHLLSSTSRRNSERVAEPEELTEPGNVDRPEPSEPLRESSAQPVDALTEPAPQDPAVHEDEISPLQPWDIPVLAEVWPRIIDDLAQQKRSLWVALSTTKPMVLEGDVLTIGFARRADAEILKKPQGPGSPLPNADLLRDSIHRRTGHRVRFTVGELPEMSPASPATETPTSSWPEVSGQEAQVQETESANDAPSPETGVEPGESSVEEVESTPTASIATRGEPVVRQLLGGELVAEELLDSMSHQGESDV
jgi:DNA polymerase-3 subunit gamma/tau